MPHAPRRRRAAMRPTPADGPSPVDPTPRPSCDPPDLGHGEARSDADGVHEAAVRSNPELVTTGRSGGTSRTADTSRLAGYVADQDRTSVVPPGAAGGPMTTVTRHCVTREQAEKRQPPQSDEDRRQRCEQKDVKTSGNTTTWKIECSGEQKMTGTGSITYQGEESYKGESTFNMQDAKRGPSTMKQTYSGKWLATACK